MEILYRKCLALNCTNKAENNRIYCSECLKKLVEKYEKDEIMNCKNCKWLCFFDGYFCGNGNEGSHEEAFIQDIEKRQCSNFEKREGKFWTFPNGEF